MLPITANNLSALFPELENNIENKGVKKRFKRIFKKMNLEFHLTMPILISLALNKFCNDKNYSDNKIRILIHQLQKHDCIDHLRWVSLVPALLGRNDLSIEVIGISTNEVIDNVSNARVAVDYFIDNEPSAAHFNSSLLQGDIESMENLDKFDLIINNNASPQDLFSLTESALLDDLFNKKIPYVIADFTQGGLLNSYNLFRNNGYSSNQDIVVNKLCSKFKSELASTEYGHGMFLLSIDNVINYSGDLTHMSFANFVTAIKCRLDHGDRLNSLDFAKEISENEVQVFPGVVLNTQNRIVKINYFGDVYSIEIEPELALTPIFTKTLDNKADRFLWAIIIYQRLIQNIQSNQEKSA